MESTISSQDVCSIFQQQCDIANQLLQALTQEFIALSGNDLQGLETSIAAKQHLMNKLEELSHNIVAMASQYSTTPKEGMAIFLKRKDPQGTWGLEGLWCQVEKLLSQCRQKNATNGKIISLNHRHIQQALEILRHGDQGSQACYSPTGAGQAPAPSRILGKV